METIISGEETWTLNADELIARASGKCGLPVRGEDSFRPALDVLLPDIGRSLTLKRGARDSIAKYILKTLIARFKVEDWFACHPEVAEHPVERPLFILGMPRAGTTLLFNLLRLDPRRRMYWHWEGNREIPPVETAHLYDDPRIARRVAEVNAALASGALPYNHHVEMGDEPAECFWSMGQDFKAYSWLLQTQVPTYFEWLMHDADMTAAYCYHKRLLQVLQSRAPGWWTLKYPSHAWALEALLGVYPDARIVMTHRDPAKPVGSSSSLCDQILSLNNVSVDRTHLGYETAKLISLSAQRAMAARDAHPEVPFHDIHYRSFVADPIGEIKRLYAFLGDDLTPEILRRMESALVAYLDQREVHGAHRYRLEDYGLSRASLAPMFADYVERYGIAAEAN